MAAPRLQASKQREGGEGRGMGSGVSCAPPSHKSAALLQRSPCPFLLTVQCMPLSPTHESYSGVAGL